MVAGYDIGNSPHDSEFLSKSKYPQKAYINLQKIYKHSTY